jgi:hypothetical protein
MIRCNSGADGYSPDVKKIQTHATGKRLSAKPITNEHVSSFCILHFAFCILHFALIPVDKEREVILAV